MRTTGCERVREWETVSVRECKKESESESESESMGESVGGSVIHSKKKTESERGRWQQGHDALEGSEEKCKYKERGVPYVEREKIADKIVGVTFCLYIVSS